MNVKRKINKAHPQYPEYIEKCTKLFQYYWELMDAEDAKYPITEKPPQDSPADSVNRKLARERNEKLREIQKEYDFLFEEVTTA